MDQTACYIRYEAYLRRDGILPPSGTHFRVTNRSQDQSQETERHASPKTCRTSIHVTKTAVSQMRASLLIGRCGSSQEALMFTTEITCFKALPKSGGCP
jgi:hypothetical protein